MSVDMETALTIVSEAINKHLGRKITPPEQTVLEGTWHKVSYKQMEQTSNFSCNYLMRDVAPRLWKLLSHIFGEQVNKHNFRSVVENSKLTRSPSVLTSQVEDRADLIKDAASLSKVGDRVLWEENKLIWNKIAKNDFVGRGSELETLKQWIVGDRLNLVSIFGMTGIGKTALCQQFVSLHQAEFECLVWLEISQPMSLWELIDRLLTKVSYTMLDKGDRYEDKLEQLLAIMKEKRCLIAIDKANLLTLSSSVNINERELWQKIALEPHQSCLLLNSSSNVSGISLLEGEKSQVRSLLLTGFSLKDARLFLAKDNKQDWNKLIEIYQGHPLALKIASKTIEDIFNGNVAEFVAQKTFIFGEIEEIFDRLFENLSKRETEIVYWLTVESEPVSLARIQKNISSFTSAELIEGLISLEKRGLLETSQSQTQSLFSIGSIIKAYVSKKLIEKVSFNSEHGVDKDNNFNVIEDAIDLSAPAIAEKTKLTNWLQGNFKTDWQPIEKLLLNAQQLSSRLRGVYYLGTGKSCKRCKSIVVGTGKQEEKVVLLVEVKSNPEQNISIRVQVYPTAEQNILPANLKLSLIDDAGNSLRDVVARDADNFMQLPLFKGKPAEKFGIRLTLDEVSVQENFII